MESFYKMYFSKNQLKRRIYDEEELENIWKEIEGKRKNTSTDTGIKFIENENIWYNITEDVESMITYIDDIGKSEIINYISNEQSEDKRTAYKEELYNDKTLNIKNIEDVYINRYKNKQVDNNIYRCSNNKTIGEYNYKSYNAENDKDIKEKLQELLILINDNKSCNVIIKATILHFYIIYLSPFVELNLEMAEDITKMYLTNNGYEIMTYCKGLELIKGDERRYYNAIENSINSNGDITYFIKYYVGIIKSTIMELTKEVSIKYGKKIIKELMNKNYILLEDRQVKFVNSMVGLSNNRISIDDYKRKSKVSYETARSDLNVLVGVGFFKISRLGKKYEYYFNDIATIIDNLNDISMKI